jgi:hypothetical protein
VTGGTTCEWWRYSKKKFKLTVRGKTPSSVLPLSSGMSTAPHNLRSCVRISKGFTQGLHGVCNGMGWVEQWDVRENVTP